MMADTKSEIDTQKTGCIKTWGIPLLIFLLALLVRVPSLDAFLTADEPHWVDRSRGFTLGLLFADYTCTPSDTQHTRPFNTTGKGCTFQTGHPGITTMWGGSLGLLTYYWQVARSAGLNLPTFLQTVSADQLYSPTLVAYMRLPMTVAAALFASFFYVLLQRLLNEWVALVSALLITLSPFHIALSRVLHHDALTAIFMVLSLLTMLGYWLRRWPWYWLIISGWLAGLAVLSKSIGLFMMPYAAVAGLLALYYRRQAEPEAGWFRLVWPVAKEGLVWGVAAALTFVTLFPAMWVIPIETIQSLIDLNFRLASEVHEKGHFFMGEIVSDPGVLFYPVGWLVRASPLEILGVLILPIAIWHRLRGQPIAAWPRQLLKRPLWVALTLFLGLLLLFETVSGKKMVRYFLPAFPVIDIFVAAGLLWLADKSGSLARTRFTQRQITSALIGLILIIQGWFVINHFPYYFTYYNPLLGGNVGAAQLITIYGWGEGLNEAAAYLNQQPQAETLHVATWYDTTFEPYFVGDTDKFSWRAGNIMNADYFIFYYNQIQRQMQDLNVWPYLQQRYAPVQRITKHGLDYALIYKNPVRQRVAWQENGLPDILTIFGYNLEPDGHLIIFWQNLGLKTPHKLQAGLTPAAGGEIMWRDCSEVPNLATNATTPGAIVESVCPLATLNAPANLYDLQLALDNGREPVPVQFPAGRLALSVEPSGQITITDPSTTLALLLEQERPAEAIPLDVTFGGLIRLVGYKFEPSSWMPGQTNNLILYWQPTQEPDLGLANAFELALHLSAGSKNEPVLTSTQPMLANLPSGQSLKRGTVVPVHYPVTAPASLSADDFSVDACLTLAETGQAVTGTVSGTSDSVECISLPLPVNFP